LAQEKAMSKLFTFVYRFTSGLTNHQTTVGRSILKYTFGIILTILVLSIFEKPVFAEESGELDPTVFDVPLNGEYGSDDDAFIVKDPVEYAAELRDNIRCLEPSCEAEIISQLQAKFDIDLEDFLQGFLLSRKDGVGYFEDVEDKLKGFKVLENFLRQHHFQKAADYVNSRINKPQDKLCVGIRYRPDMDDYISCDIEVPGNKCEKHCLKEGIPGLVKSMEEGDKKLKLLEALEDTHSQSYNAVLGVCKVKNPSYKDTQVVARVGDTNANLCGILTANSVITALLGKGSKFTGGSQSAPTEYSCSFVNLSIDKTSAVWRANPDYPEDNYVILADGETRYQLKPEDIKALQDAVNKVKPKLKIGSPVDSQSAQTKPGVGQQ
jgi:hypothetical protein